MIEQAPTGKTETKNVNTSESSVQRGSGNGFADLDIPDADSHLLKAEPVNRIDGVQPEAPSGYPGYFTKRPLPSGRNSNQATDWDGYRRTAIWPSRLRA